VIFFLLSHGHFVEIVNGITLAHVDIEFGISNTSVNHFSKSVLSESEGEHISWKSFLGIDTIVVVNSGIVVESNGEFSVGFSEVVNLEISVEGVHGVFLTSPGVKFLAGDVNQSKMDLRVVIDEFSASHNGSGDIGHFADTTIEELSALEILPGEESWDGS